MASDTSAVPKTAGNSPNKSVFSKITWYEFLAIPFVAVGVTIYWLRETISGFFQAAHEGVALWLGAGIVPLALWLGASLGVLILKPHLFRRYRLWLASIPLMALAFGALALFRPLDGALAWFTLDGYVSLGGIVGETIAGAALWQQILRLGALAAVAIAIASPVFVAVFAMTVGRLLMYLYVSLALATKGIGGLFKRKPLDPDEESNPQEEPLAAYNDAKTDYDPMGLRSGLTDAYGYTERQESSFARAAAPFTIDSTMGESASDRASRTATITDTAVANLQESEEVDMQANTDYDFGYSRSANGSMAAVAEPDNPDIESDLTDDYDSDESLTANEHDDYADDSPFDDDDYNDLDGVDVMDALADTPPAQQEEKQGASGLRVPLLGKRREKWAMPSIQLLEGVQDRGIPEEQIRETAETIRQTLADYGIEVEIGDIKYGPTVTMYGLIPGWIRRYKQVKLEDERGNPILDEKGKQITTRQEQKTRVKVDSIFQREKDLSLALKTPSLRIETPVMGKAQVGIEIPNREPAPVTLRSIMESAEYKNLKAKSDLPVALGKGTGGENLALDLAKMPHLLIAGATGSGKSVALNAIVAGLLMERSPSEMRMLLVDPKRVELTPYNGIPHLLCPVIVEVDEVVGMLKGVINEMMGRYRRMEEVGVRNIEAFNKRMPDERMPFLLVVVDELADLMMTAAFDIEQSLCRLAQLGRATGIHLVLATQRPSVDVVTGLIKANFPSRISFGVTSHIDSRTILDTNGAEKLLGKGDMLYLPRDAARPMRAQGAFISDKEIDKLIDFWQATPRAWLPSVNLRPVSEDDSDGDENRVAASTDALFDKAVELAHAQKKLSTSLLQRRLRIGYPRAARLMDELEENGIVSASDGSKSRDVIISA